MIFPVSGSGFAVKSLVCWIPRWSFFMQGFSFDSSVLPHISLSLPHDPTFIIFQECRFLRLAFWFFIHSSCVSFSCIVVFKQFLRFPQPLVSRHFFKTMFTQNFLLLSCKTKSLFVCNVVVFSPEIVRGRSVMKGAGGGERCYLSVYLLPSSIQYIMRSKSQVLVKVIYQQVLWSFDFNHCRSFGPIRPLIWRNHRTISSSASIQACWYHLFSGFFPQRGWQEVFYRFSGFFGLKRRCQITTCWWQELILRRHLNSGTYKRYHFCSSVQKSSNFELSKKAIMASCVVRQVG